MVADLFGALLAAVRFLTVVPVRAGDRFDSVRLSQAMVWFPVVGFLLGGTLAVADLGLRAVLPAWAGAGLLLALWVALTGALHLDGFLDSCDGLFAARSPRERLEILRDPHTGSFAVAGGICLLLVKFGLLVELPAVGRSLTLLVVPGMSRAAAVYAARAFPYARAGPGLGRSFREELRWSQVFVAAAAAVGVATLALGWAGLAAVALVWVLTTFVGRWAVGRLGGLTGDVYGAIVELTEVGALVFLLAVSKGVQRGLPF